MKKPVEAAEVVARIFQQVELDEINQEVDAMTDEQIEKGLLAEGYTKDKVDAAFAKQQAMLDTMLGDERRQRRAQALSYVGGVATAAAVVLVARSATQGSTVVPTTTAIAAAPTSASDLRKEAFEACGRGHWNDCARLLDEAKALDPVGESDPDVVNARKLVLQR